MSETFHDTILQDVGNWLQQRQTEPLASARDQLAGEGEIRELEAALCRIHGFRHALAVNNATNGLLLLALAFPTPHSTVLCGPGRWKGTWRPFEIAGHRVRHAVSGTRGLRWPMELDSDCRIFLSSGASSQVPRIAVRHRLWHILDAAAEDPRRRITSTADALVLSFGPGKVVDAGEGGAILINDSAIYARLLACGQHPRRFARDVSLADASDDQPLNTRMHPLAALIARHLLEFTHPR